MRQKPTEPKVNYRQIEFLRYVDVPEILFGGAAGGGKSSALLMAALQFVGVPGYAAIIFRRTYADLALPGALMDRALGLLSGTGAHWNGQEKCWTFPSGATLSFGYLDNDNDRFRYQSSEFQYIAFDELTQFKERDYRFLFSRLRRAADNQVPLRMRAGSNPGGVGHLWVKNRFLKGDNIQRKFIPALLEDNPYIDIESYEQSLEQLDSQTRRQYRKGDWTDFGGNHYYPGAWPRYLDTGDAYRIRLGDGQYHHFRKAECTRIITLDWALGKPKKGSVGAGMGGLASGGFNSQGDSGGQENGALYGGDCTAFLVADLADDGAKGLLFLLGAVCDRIPLARNVPKLAEMCRRWEPLVVASDDDNFSEAMILDCRRFNEIPPVRTVKIGGKNKLARSQSSILRAERGMVYLPMGEPVWAEVLSDQLAAFSGADGEADDLADCASILGRLADEFAPGTTDTDTEPVVGADMGYSGAEVFGADKSGYDGGW